ncbi:hypothetical protein [Parasitella parasitica]|uniref:CCHC-type domain-containing protein n=1 Tax=Parasitella parasitica TaxID=35722 RepID=A0A0B7NPZ6_9FUNG|nr:hypothetical protein [Parasitella parasitica]
MTTYELTTSIRIWLKQYEQQARIYGIISMDNCATHLTRYMPLVIQQWIPTLDPSIVSSWSLLKEALITRFGIPEEDNRLLLKEIKACKPQANESVQPHAAKWEHLLSLITTEYTEKTKITYFIQSLNHRDTKLTLTSLVFLMMSIDSLSQVINHATELEVQAKLLDEPETVTLQNSGSDPMDLDYMPSQQQYNKKLAYNNSQPKQLRVYDKHGNAICDVCSEESILPLITTRRMCYRISNITLGGEANMVITENNRGRSASRYAPGNLGIQGEQGEQGISSGGEGEEMSVSQAPDLFDLCGTPMTDVENASQHDGESVREMVLASKDQYDGFVRYFGGQRQELIKETHKKAAQFQIVARSLEFVDPVSRFLLQQLIDEIQAAVEADAARVQDLDNRVEATRMEITNTLTGILHAGPKGNMNDLVREFNWLTLEVCQDFGLPMDYQYMILDTYNSTSVTRSAAGEATVQVEPQEVADNLYLRNRIAILEAHPIDMDRRRLHRFTTFKHGTPYKAEQWLTHFDTLADYLGFSPDKRAQELTVVLQGRSLKWYTGLDPSTKKDWSLVQKSFLNLHAYGSDPALLAFDELETYSQGDKSMAAEFGPEITELLKRAQVYSPGIQLEYLKRALNTQLEQAVIYRGADTLGIASEIERSLKRAKQPRYQGKGSGGNNYGDKSNSGKGKTDNPHKNKKCHSCGKTGHIKRNCWSKKDQKQNNQELQDPQVSKVQDADTDPGVEEDVDDNFAHIMAVNNNHAVKDQDQVYTRSGDRFKLKILVDPAQVQQDVLVDTNSIVSTISRATVNRLKLEEFACQQQVINYGNTITQEATTSKAILNFTFNSDDSSRVFLLIVPSRNEEVILGNNWLQKEDILLQAKDKKVYKNKIQASNNADLVVDERLSQFPSPAENEAIAKECSPVVLIKKPDGSFRFCVDYYRNLNKVTVKDKFPLSLISDLLEQLQGYSIFTTCDLKSGFWKLPLNKDDGSAKKTAFQANDSLINPKICQWFSKEVKFLGFLVSGEGIRSNPEKVKVVKDWKAPVNKKGLLRFLGFAVFYHRFINSLSSKAKPLYALLKKDVDYIWDSKAKQAFDLIKQELISLPTLAYPNPQLPYDLHWDASDVVLGACVVQMGRPIAFASKTLNSAESNYNTTEKECLAIVWALKQFHPYLYGSKFTIYTDHASLKSILGADLAIQYMLRDGVRKPHVWHNDLVCYEGEGRAVPFVPVGLIEQQVLLQVHSKNTAGHFGVDKTYTKARENWLVAKHGCRHLKQGDDLRRLQRFKVRNDSTRPPMKPITPKHVGEIWATDIATLPESHTGERYLLVLMEYLSK